MFKNPFESNEDQFSSLTINLLPTQDNTWDEKLSVLMKDEYISRKYNREKRIKDHIEYLKFLCPDFFEPNTAKGLNVIDIGPGPGELLEIARIFGFKAIGFDAKTDDCEMGEPYITLSKLLVERQKINVHYCGFENILDNLPVESCSTFLVNSRGSIEQVFKHHLIGPPHKDHHDARRLAWNFSDNMRKDFIKLFREISRVLVPEGYFVIHGNGTSNIDEYNNFMLSISNDVNSIVCDGTDNKLIHRFRRLRT